MRNRLATHAHGLVLIAAFLLARPVVAEEVKKSPPRLVLLIRHAEKPALESMSVDLSPAGQKRAAALHGLFEKSPSRPIPLLTPDFIFAAKDSKHSHRCTETVAPLAKKLGLKVNAKIANDDFPKLAAEILGNPKYAGKTVLICWHHGNLPDLAKKLGARESPDRWKGTVFDRVWRIRYTSSGEATLDEIPQRLLPDEQK
jgi:broad specificity phosphatase PhoE